MKLIKNPFRAFTSAAILEACHYKQTGELKELSEQSLIDCASTADYGNYGCNGGRMTNAMEYTKLNGIPLKSDYPYVGNDLGSCNQDKVTSNFLNSGYEMVPKSEIEMQRIVASYGNHFLVWRLMRTLKNCSFLSRPSSHRNRLIP